jgi:hypothetical protein
VPRISIINNGKLVRTVDLGAGEMIIGRGDEVAIQLKHPLISRKHARVILTPAGYVVEDQGTKNGTFVKGRRVQRHRLLDGDELEIADFLLQYHADGFVPPEEDAGAAAGAAGGGAAGGGGGAGLVAKDRKKEGAKSPLEQYMEALKRGGSNATAAIPPEAMARLREQARKKATPRIQIDGAPALELKDKVTVFGWGGGSNVGLAGRWIWVKEALRLSREDVTVRAERLSLWCPVKVNGKAIGKGKPMEIKAGDKLTVGKREIVLLEGDPLF